MAILAGFTMTLLVGGRATLDGDLDIGLFSSLVYMTQRLLWPLTRLGETLDLYQRAMASCRRIFGLLEVQPSIQPGARVLDRPVRGAVRFDGVRFDYGVGAAGEVLQGFDLDIAAGRDPRHRRRHRRRQEHHREAAPPPLRAHRTGRSASTGCRSTS